MEEGLSYLFTKYGEVYVGNIFDEYNFPHSKVIVPRVNIKEYIKLSSVEKTQKRINELGWVIPKNTIAELLYLSDEEYKKYEPKIADKNWDSTYDRRVMFIMGAGASANCVFSDQKEIFSNDFLRPPCGPELFQKRFDSIYNKFPGVKQSLHFLQGDGNDVESLFEQEWEEIYEHGNDQIISRHINIQYYLQDLLQRVSLHINGHYSDKNLFADLANKLMILYQRDSRRKRKFAFISFNQDTILEFFLKTYFRIRIESLDDYTRINDGPISIFKPHGSWNWGWEFPSLPQSRLLTHEWLFAENVNLYKLYFELLGSREKMIDWNSYGLESGLNEHGLGKFKVNKSNLSLIPPGNENLYYPSLLLPYRDKDEFTMPSSHFWDLNNYLPYVETLVIIGWKGNESHFNRILKTQARNIKKVIIADPSPAAVENQLRFLADNKVEIIRYKGFEEFMKTGFDKEIQ